MHSVNIFLTKFTLDDSAEMTLVRNGTFKVIPVKLKTYMVLFGVCGSIIFVNSTVRNHFIRIVKHPRHN